MRAPGSTAIAVTSSHSIVADINDAGSAGVPGYDGATYESLLQDYNSAVNYGDQYEVEGNDPEAASNYNLSSRIYTQLTDNCLVVES